MARATHVLKARKDIPGTDIKAGDSYYWWKFRFGGKHYSKTAPRRSQLTQSDFLGQMYDLEDEISDLPADESLADTVPDIAQRLRDLADECQEKYDNMPDNLRDNSESGQMLQERVDNLGSAADEFENIDLGEWEEDATATAEAREEDEEADPVNADGETAEEYWKNKLDEVQAVCISY